MCRKKTKKGGSTQPLTGKSGSTLGGDKNLAASTATVAGKAGSRLTLISARGPAGSTDRSNAKLDGSSAEDIEK
jgi:hypothetical protein